MLQKILYITISFGCLLVGLIFVAYWNLPLRREYVPPREFDPWSVSSQPLYNIKNNGRAGCMDRAGNIVIQPEYDDIRCSSDKLIPFEMDGQWGYLSQNGHVILEPQFVLAAHGYSNNFGNGLAAVCQNSKCGYIDESGKYAIPPQFDYPGQFYDGFAIVGMGSASLLGWRYREPVAVVINTKGEIIYGEPDIIPNDNFGDGLARVKINGRSAFIDSNRTIAFFSDSVQAGQFNEGLAAFGTKELYRFGYINKGGKIVIPQQFKQAGEFSDGLASVMFENGKYGYIDKTGKTVIEPQFDSADTFYEGLAVVSMGYKKGYIDRTGSIVIPIHFGSAERFKDGLAQVSFDDENPPYETKKYGYIDGNGTFVRNPSN